MRQAVSNAAAAAASTVPQGPEAAVRAGAHAADLGQHAAAAYRVRAERRS